LSPNEQESPAGWPLARLGYSNFILMRYEREAKIGNGGRGGSESQTGCRFDALKRRQMAGKLYRPSGLNRLGGCKV
jgi:hypothetical protein